MQFDGRLKRTPPVCPNRAWGSDSRYIANQPLLFHWMTLSKVIRAEEGIPTSQSGSRTPKVTWVEEKTVKIIPCISRFPLPGGDPTGVTSANNQSIFRKWFRVKLSGLQRGFLHHKVAPRSQKQPESTKEISKMIFCVHSTFRSVNGDIKCYIATTK